MSGINRAFLFGHIKGKPIFDERANNQCMFSFEFTTTEILKYGIEHMENHHIVMYGLTASAANNVLLEGMMMHLEGSVKTIYYYDVRNIKRYETHIQCLNFEVLSLHKLL